MQDKFTDLIYAIEGDHPLRVEQLIAAGVDVNAPIVPGDYYRDAPALLRAADLGNERICRLLVEAGADIAATNSRGTSALHAAAGSYDADVCRYLIACGADVNARDDVGLTPLFAAVQSRSMEVVDALLAGGADPDARSVLDTTALHFAAAGRHLEMGQRLLDCGVTAQVPARVCDAYEGGSWAAAPLGNVTALHGAVGSGSLKFCKMLVAHGASPSFQPERAFDKGYQSPLQVAIEKKWYDIVQFFLFECQIDFGQLTVGDQKRTLTELADGDEKIIEWLRAAETQQSVCRAIEVGSGVQTSQGRRSASVGPL